ITRQRQVGELVVGLPVNTAGADSSKTVQVREFIKALKMRTTIPVKPWDERFTTCEAGEELKKLGLNSRTSKKFIDMMAATLILRSYLESL
ncbi:MAG: Holliday junction resolvase RuvX, partial [Candidatus Cloacimonetes bacterium]|nr:Holliday junction resolvase RuvX [Candidatus Cloacimonadota bacterium]